MDGTHRKALTLWEVLGRLDYRTGVLGWPAAVPSRAPVEFAFSERYFRGEPTEAQATPAELVERGLLFRLGPSEVPPELLQSLGFEDDSAPHELRVALADDLWRTGLTSFLLEQEPDLHSLFLRLPGLADVSDRDYQGFDAVVFGGRSAQKARTAAATVTGYYRFLDAQISRLWEAWPAPKTLAILSTHGYQAPPAWRRFVDPVLGALIGSGADREADGVLVLWSIGTRATSLDRAELADVMPTLLYALGLPLPRDLDGRVLTACFTSEFLARHPLTFVPSYETVVVPDPEAIAPAEAPAASSEGESGDTIEQRP